MGKQGSAKGSVGSFAKTCFDPSVGGWSARIEQKTRFLIAFLAFSEPELSVNKPGVFDFGAEYARFLFNVNHWLSQALSAKPSPVSQ